MQPCDTKIFDLALSFEPHGPRHSCSELHMSIVRFLNQNWMPHCVHNQSILVSLFLVLSFLWCIPGSTARLARTALCCSSWGLLCICPRSSVLGPAPAEASLPAANGSVHLISWTSWAGGNLFTRWLLETRYWLLYFRKRKGQKHIATVVLGWAVQLSASLFFSQLWYIHLHWHWCVTFIVLVSTLIYHYLYKYWLWKSKNTCLIQTTHMHICDYICIHGHEANPCAVLSAVCLQGELSHSRKCQSGITRLWLHL